MSKSTRARGRAHHTATQAGEAVLPTGELRAVGLAECCRLIGISLRTGEAMVAIGTFPVPELPRIGRRHRYSTFNIDHYLTTAADADVD